LIALRIKIAAYQSEGDGWGLCKSSLISGFLPVFKTILNYGMNAVCILKLVSWHHNGRRTQGLQSSSTSPQSLYSYSLSTTESVEERDERRFFLQLISTLGGVDD